MAAAEVGFWYTYGLLSRKAKSDASLTSKTGKGGAKRAKEEQMQHHRQPRKAEMF